MTVGKGKVKAVNKVSGKAVDDIVAFIRRFKDNLRNVRDVGLAPRKEDM